MFIFFRRYFYVPRDPVGIFREMQLKLNVVVYDNYLRHYIDLSLIFCIVLLGCE